MRWASKGRGRTGADTKVRSLSSWSSRERGGRAARAREMRSVRVRVRVRVRARCIWVREPEGCSGEKTEAPGWGGGQRGPAALAPP